MLGKTGSLNPLNVPDENHSSPVMVYTAHYLIWGDLILKAALRVSTYLRTNVAPEAITLYNARTLLTTSGTSKPVAYPELSLATSQILAYHLVPPNRDPIDYDPTEPNRKMEPIYAIVGPFRIEGSLRLAAKSDLAKYLDLTHEQFTAVYDAEITHPLMPQLGGLQVPYLLVRQQTAMFCTHPTA